MMSTENSRQMSKKRSNIELSSSNDRSAKRQKSENLIFFEYILRRFSLVVIVGKEIDRTKLEDLPNELFYKIFSYLTDGELFHSFDFSERNLRLERLIIHRTKLNFRSIDRDRYLSNRDRLNREMIREIYLFNDDQTPGIINSFFSFYSFDLFNCFPNLQNLVLDQPEQIDLLVK